MNVQNQQKSLASLLTWKWEIKVTVRCHQTTIRTGDIYKTDIKWWPGRGSAALSRVAGGKEMSPFTGEHSAVFPMLGEDWTHRGIGVSSLTAAAGPVSPCHPFSEGVEGV